MVFPSQEEQIEKFEKDHVAQHYFEVLRTLISKKSVFAQQVGLKEVARYLGEIFKRVGAEVEIDESYTAPFVMAHFKSSRPNAKTIIFYHHYDTVPADNDQPWTNDPFTLSVHYGVMYGRGVDDDKGHITARLTAVRKYIREHGSLPVNIIFMMEGAEESASTDLDKYLAKHKKHLRGADLLVWEQGSRNNLGQLEISGGNKGIVTFDMTVKSADVDIHSSFGGVINSASWYLLNALSSLRSPDGRILVEGIYEHAGKIRDYNITKKEWVLNGETVLYAGADSIRETLDYDFAREKEYNYRHHDTMESVNHITQFISDKN